MDNATAAATIEELETEIESLKRLENLARDVVRSGQDAKWNQLNSILDDPLMTDENGHRRKLVVFSEFRDTLAYLSRRVRNRLGRDEAVVEIHGSVTREARRRFAARCRITTRRRYPASVSPSSASSPRRGRTARDAGGPPLCFRSTMESVAEWIKGRKDTALVADGPGRGECAAAVATDLI